MTATSRPAVEITRAGPLIGAEITGVDLGTEVDPAVADQLRQAFRDHEVLVFRGQHLSPERHLEAVRLFAEPFDHPTAT